MPFDGGLPKRYWDEGVLTTAFIQNRLPSKAVKLRTGLYPETSRFGVFVWKTLGSRSRCQEEEVRRQTEVANIREIFGKPQELPIRQPWEAERAAHSLDLGNKSEQLKAYSRHLEEAAEAAVNKTEEPMKLLGCAGKSPNQRMNTSMQTNVRKMVVWFRRIYHEE